MKTNKGAIGIILAIILAIIIVGGGAYYLGKNSSQKKVENNPNFQNQNERQINSNTQIQNNKQSDTISSTENNSVNSPTTLTDSNILNLNSCGVSLSKASNWSTISNTNNEIKLDIVPNDHTGFSGIDIKCVLDSTITDTDAKFGNITYYYDSNNKKWMVNKPDEMNGGFLPAVEAAPEFTVNGLPVFRGTRRWLSYIIPISPNSILYLNEGDAEGGYTQTLTNLVKTLKKF